MWVKFLRDVDWVVPSDHRVSIAYRKDCAYSVRKSWAETLIGRGVAVRAPVPRRVPSNDGAKPRQMTKSAE